MVKVIEMGMMVVIGAIVISFGVYVGNEIIIKQAQDIKEFCAAPNNCTEYNHRNNLEQYIKECCWDYCLVCAENRSFTTITDGGKYK